VTPFELVEEALRFYGS